LPKESNLILLELKKWYKGRKKPKLQIEIMREIALKGAQTKSELAESLGCAHTTIANTFANDKNKKPELILFQQNEPTTKQNVKQPVHSVTYSGMIMLSSSHYNDDEKNMKKGIEGKPILNVNEFHKFLSRCKTESKVNFKDFKKDKILQELASVYFMSNQPSHKEFFSKFRDKELNNLKKDLSKIESKMKKFKIEKKEQEDMISEYLAMKILSSLKK